MFDCKIQIQRNCAWVVSYQDKPTEPKSHYVEWKPEGSDTLTPLEERVAQEEALVEAMKWAWDAHEEAIKASDPDRPHDMVGMVREPRKKVPPPDA